MHARAAIAFIVCAAAGAVYLSRQPTIAHGDVLASDVQALPAYRGSTDVTCDDRVPIGADGADFSCAASDPEGRVQNIACSFKPSGAMACHTVEPTGPARRTPPL